MSGHSCSDTNAIQNKRERYSAGSVHIIIKNENDSRWGLLLLKAMQDKRSYLWVKKANFVCFAPLFIMLLNVGLKSITPFII